MHGRDRRGLISRPTVAETRQYRRHVDYAVLELMQSLEDQQYEQVEPLIVLGLHHEQQHQELLLTDIKHVLSQNPLHPVYQPASDPDRSNPVRSRALDWVPFGEGLHGIGHDGTSFCYDHETPRDRQFVHAFEPGSRLVNNGEYREFIQDGGYQRPEFWLSRSKTDSRGS
jgi:formylglycine-generating enzyme required for sulfatase activity